MIRFAKAFTMTAEQHDRLAEEVREEGHCLIPNLLPKVRIAEWNRSFQPLLASHLERVAASGAQNRGTNRYYVTLPFMAPFADPVVFADPDILAIVDRLVGPDRVMCQLASDTPLKGSDYQALHRDAPPLFPEWGQETPPFQLAVNFPLVDVTNDNGPFETTRRTHKLPKDEALERITRGEIPIERIFMNVGDIMIRDVRCIHRGTPNWTDQPRPMVVIGYSRAWLRRPEVSIRIPRAVWAAMPTEYQHLLRGNPLVDRFEPQDEVYEAFAY